MALPMYSNANRNWPAEVTPVVQYRTYMINNAHNTPAPGKGMQHLQHRFTAPYGPNPTTAHQYQEQGFDHLLHQNSLPGILTMFPFRAEYQDHGEPARVAFEPEWGTSPISMRRSPTTSVRTNPGANARTITYNETIDPADRVNFETDVDELMKAIQTQAEKEAVTQGPTPVSTPRMDDACSPVSPQDMGSAAAADEKPKKKWVCDGPNCNKSFIQKTHLNIHRRAHTGAKPYVCTFEGCGLTFSQRGNLKTHMRRHTGEKPFSCRICGKPFAHGGNVRSHETHKGERPYVCILDGCNKLFSQLGNMKTHQNNFHKETLKGVTGLFINFARTGEIPEDQRELFEYFKEHYKNSNKGVKGRGKARTVAARKPKSQKTAAAQARIARIPQ